MEPRQCCGTFQLFLVSNQALNPPPLSPIIMGFFRRDVKTALISARLASAGHSISTFNQPYLMTDRTSDLLEFIQAEEEEESRRLQHEQRTEPADDS